ncbi:MAG: hypothetical protein H6648_05690 [Caldilineae bacterium]|nr:hypothetical protein [Caldilineae bacterium]
MSHDAEADRQLQAALERLAAGEPLEDILEGMPEALRAPLRTAGLLSAAAPRSGDLAGVGFVLGLEDQLRTDLRLRLAGPQQAPAQPGRPIWMAPRVVGLSLLLTILSGLLVATVASRALPGQPLDSLRRGAEALGQVWPRDRAGAAEQRLDSAWQRQLELSRRIEAGQGSAPSTERLLEALLTDYRQALRLAAESGDRRVALRADGEAEAAAGRLGELVALAPETLRPRLEQAVEALAEARRRLAASTPLEPVPIVDAGPAQPSATSGSLATASPSPELPRDPAPPSATPVAGDTAVAPAPSATAGPSQIAPTASPTASPRLPATASPVPERPRPTRDPQRTATPPPSPQPQPTEPPPPPAPAPTWTSEPAWPTAVPPTSAVEPTQPAKPTDPAGPTPDPPDPGLGR